MPADVVLGHLGGLHPYEHALVYLLAFGPFVLLAVVVRVARRRDARETEGAKETEDAAALRRRGG